MWQIHSADNYLLIASILFIFATCGQRNTQAERDDRIKRDHAEISALLDKALLSPSPVDSLKALIPKVKSFESVDSAWVSGSNFFVQYKHGGIVSWIVPPKSTN
jgi:hypothetical protein